MEKVVTKDNSVTFRSEKYTECYHSVSGAIEEAFEKFARPCKLKDGMKVLDVCFGIGYTSLAAISIANVEIIGLENDPEILAKTAEVEVADEFKENYEKIRKAAKSLSYSDEKTKIKILLGDARETIKKIDEKFDAVLMDPFSPKKCPELWTLEFISEIAKRMKPGAVLTTYSYARAVRENLKSAGLIVTDGPVIGRRSPATIATAPIV